MLRSYRNQSVDLQTKSTDWFLRDGKLVVKRLKDNIQIMEYNVTNVALFSDYYQCATENQVNYLKWSFLQKL